VSANLDLVRSIFADWERGDFRSTEWADPGIESVSIDGPQPGERTGLPALAEGFRGFLSTWEGYRVEADEYRELADGRVLVLLRDAGRGRVSGMEIGRIRGERAMVFRIREGKVTRFVTYWDRDNALADLGLEE
jgi:ketosteroid isomerase-like protein